MGNDNDQKTTSKTRKNNINILNKQIGIFENNNYDFDVHNEDNWGIKTL